MPAAAIAGLIEDALIKVGLPATDGAKVAELMGRGALPSNIATMGSTVLATIHGLVIIEDNLQDLDENFTSFLWVQRPAILAGDAQVNPL